MPANEKPTTILVNKMIWKFFGSSIINKFVKAPIRQQANIILLGLYLSEKPSKTKLKVPKIKPNWTEFVRRPTSWVAKPQTSVIWGITLLGLNHSDVPSNWAKIIIKTCLDILVFWVMPISFIKVYVSTVINWCF